MRPFAPPRSEYKFTVEEPLAQALAAWAAPWVETDPHVRPGRVDYTITSLYLDSPDLAFYWAKRTLQFARVKARIRTYGESSDGPVFVELKRRFGDVSRKTRAEVARSAWGGIVDPTLATGTPEELALRPHGRAVLTDFVALLQRYALRPVVLVRYDREPYRDRLNSRTRLTFDRRLRCRGPASATLGANDRYYRAIDYAAMFQQTRSQVIVEMKFDGVAPRWMLDLVCRFDILRTSFSKYATGVDALHEERQGGDPVELAPRAKA